MGSDTPALVSRLTEMNHRLREELKLRDGVMRAEGLVQWLSDDGMGEDNNDVWDWDGNNDK